MKGLSREEITLYSRNIKIPEIGIQGQQKLKAASVLIIGLGGLGSASALYLAAAGVGNLGLVDFDRVELSNLNRQVIHDMNALGKMKVESARERLVNLNPNIQVDIYPQLISESEGEDILKKYPIIVDGTDNFETRYLINVICVKHQNTYVYGAVFQFSGQVSVFDARRGPCFYCVFEKMPTQDVVEANRNVGVIGSLPGTIGTIQSIEVIKLLLGIGTPLVGRLLLYDALDMHFAEVMLKKSPKCPVCSGK